MLRNVIDIIVGLLIVMAVVFMCNNWYQRTRVPGVEDHYKLNALFTDMTGLEIGSDVKISGIPVGYVSGYLLDTQSYMAKVVLAIHYSVKIPVDTIAAISSDGLFGKKYLKLSPGSSADYYNENDTLEITQPAINFENLISGLVFKNAD